MWYGNCFDTDCRLIFISNIALVSRDFRFVRQLTQYVYSSGYALEKNILQTCVWLCSYMYLDFNINLDLPFLRFCTNRLELNSLFYTNTFFLNVQIMKMSW